MLGTLKCTLEEGRWRKVEKGGGAVIAAPSR